MHKKIAAGLLAGLTAFTFLLPLPRAEAVDVWGAAAQALGIFGIYQSSLSSVLAMGNNVHAQIQSRQQDLKENGRDPNRHDIDVVNGVMQQLVGQADYALKDNNLPFIWSVNDSKDFNAACYPTNYVSINRALVRGLNCDPDEIAAVLGHELTHGLEQHSAHNYARAAAQYYGLSFLNMDAGLMDWNKLAALADYSIAKNVTLPTEYEADKGGFYLMTSAGFNPGGGAAAMARMDYYFTYETENPLEVQSIDVKNKNQENFNDHPDTS
ncbi:MAG TPA: peptidase M48, partial [Selenomonas sp.]|nr:peptidase M48 [Selenomonas sp.]